MKEKYDNKECAGCGVTISQLIEKEFLTYKQIEDNEKTTVEGNWYCHNDCFRDRGC